MAEKGTDAVDRTILSYRLGLETNGSMDYFGFDIVENITC